MTWGRDRPWDSHCQSRRSCCKSRDKGEDTGNRGVVDREGKGHRVEEGRRG